MSFARPSKPLLYGKHFLGILDSHVLMILM